MKGLTFTKSSANGYTKSIFNKVIPYDQVYSFRVKIIKAPKRDVNIGIVDYENCKTVI